MVKTCILSASCRKNNNTLRLAKHMGSILKENYSIIDYQDYDLPNFNQEFLDRSNLSKFQTELIEEWASANLIIVLCPEYNWFPTPEIINTVNQLGSDKNKDLWDQKVFAFAGVSSGRGGRMPAVQLTYVFNKIISYTHSESICSPKIYESHFTPKLIDIDGVINEDENTHLAIQRFVEYNHGIAKKWIGA